jgi:hypothetical protein
MAFRSNRNVIFPMSSEPLIGRPSSSPNPRKRRRRGEPSQSIGDVYLKKLSIKPRQHWPQWVITRIAPNEDGIMHATLSLIGNEATTRRMSTAVLDEQEDWELLQKADEGAAASDEA